MLQKGEKNKKQIRSCSLLLLSGLIPEPMLVNKSPSVKSLSSTNQRKHIKRSFQTKTSFKRDTTNTMNTLNHTFKMFLLIFCLNFILFSLLPLVSFLKQIAHQPLGLLPGKLAIAAPAKKECTSDMLFTFRVLSGVFSNQIITKSLVVVWCWE